MAAAAGLSVTLVYRADGATDSRAIHHEQQTPWNVADRLYGRVLEWCCLGLSVTLAWLAMFLSSLCPQQDSRE